MLHLAFGALHSLQGNLPAALQAFDRSIEVNPSYPQSYARKGRVLIMMQKYQTRWKRFATLFASTAQRRFGHGTCGQDGQNSNLAVMRKLARPSRPLLEHCQPSSRPGQPCIAARSSR